jgi:hypothetical protein
VCTQQQASFLVGKGKGDITGPAADVNLMVTAEIIGAELPSMHAAMTDRNKAPAPALEDDA